MAHVLLAQSTSLRSRSQPVSVLLVHAGPRPDGNGPELSHDATLCKSTVPSEVLISECRDCLLSAFLSQRRPSRAARTPGPANLVSDNARAFRHKIRGDMLCQWPSIPRPVPEFQASKFCGKPPPTSSVKPGSSSQALGLGWQDLDSETCASPARRPTQYTLYSTLYRLGTRRGIRHLKTGNDW